MRSVVIVLLCLLTTSVTATQLFIPVDETGKPLQQTPEVPAIDAAPAEVVSAEEPAAKVVREAREAEYALALSAATDVYAGCINSESRRLLGPDYEKCSDARTKLQALYPADKANSSLSCVEAAVLGKARNAGAPCHLVARAPPDTTNTGRWK